MKIRKWKSVLLMAACSAIGDIGYAAASVDATSRCPNILYIMADDLGWRDTAVYGSTFYETPHIDALAESGMRFTDAYSANPLCSATRASIMTGRYPVRTGFLRAGGHQMKLGEFKAVHRTMEELRSATLEPITYLDPNYFTLGEAMRDAGYATGFFGKWHMGRRAEHYPENNGFDVVRGGRWHHSPPGHWKNACFPPWQDCETLPSDIPEGTHVDDLLVDLTIEYMKEQKEAGKPFFICHWPYSVHAPFQSKPELIKKWRQKVDPDDPQHSPTMAAMVEVLDSNVGRLMQALKDNGLDENTIVIFSSDNGGNMYDTVDGTTPTSNLPLQNGKANTYEGGVRVPLIVRWPGVTKPGSVNPAVVSTVDHYPAFLEMIGKPLRPDDHVDGVSYVPALIGETFDRGPTICDFSTMIPSTGNIPNTWIRVGDWKLFRFWHDDRDTGGHRYELYNVRTDLGERNNLAASQPERLKAMVAELDSFYQNNPEILKPHPNQAFNPNTVGTWFSRSAGGTLSAEKGSLVIQSTEPGFAVKNRYFPTIGKSGFLVFEARSPTTTTLEFAGTEEPVTVSIGRKWQTHKLSSKEVRMVGAYGDDHVKTFEMTLPDAGTVEIRNAHIVTADGTIMRRYTFY